MKKNKQKSCPNCGSLSQPHRRKLHKLGCCYRCMPLEMKCIAKTVEGKQCPNPRLTKVPFCSVHRLGAKGNSKTFGYVYLMKLGFGNLYKVGASVNPKQRLISLQASNPRLKLMKVWYVKGYERVETMGHTFLNDYKIEREIFQLDLDQVASFYIFMMEIEQQQKSKGLLDSHNPLI